MVSIEMTTRDKLLIAWHNSMELVRDFESYSKEIKDEKVSKVFAEYAEDEGHHASNLLGMLHEYDAK